MSLETEMSELLHRSTQKLQTGEKFKVNKSENYMLVTNTSGQSTDHPKAETPPFTITERIQKIRAEVDDLQMLVQDRSNQLQTLVQVRTAKICEDISDINKEIENVRRSIGK